MIVHLLKKIAISIRIVYLIFLELVVAMHTNFSVGGIQFFSVIILLLLMIEFGLFIAILVFRIKGLFRNGISDRYIELEEPRSELTEFVYGQQSIIKR